MSMEAYALCDRPLRSIAEWQAAIDASGFDLKLRPASDPVGHRGHLPAFWRGREAGFEWSTIPVSDLSETYEEMDFGGPWSCVYAFYFGTLPSCAGAWIAISACLSLAGGLAFDAHDGVLMNSDQARDYARNTENDVDRLEARFPGPIPH